MGAGLGVEDGCERLVWIEEERFGGERRGGCECHFREAERQSRLESGYILCTTDMCVNDRRYQSIFDIIWHTVY